MTVRNVTSAQQGMSAYAEAMRTQRMERIAAQAAESLAASSAKATVRKQSVGFSLGKFSIDFTTQDVELPPETARRTTANSRAAHFAEEMDAASLLYETASASTAANPTQSAQAAPADTPLARRKALEAYAQASLDEFRVPGRIGSV